MTQPDNHFWDITAGRARLPPCSDLLGFQLLEVGPQPGTLRACFTVRPEFLNPAGLVQGGILTAMLDDVMSAALAATLAPGEFGATLRLAVRFVRAARAGVLSGAGRVTRRFGHQAVLRGRLTDSRGRLLATALARVQLLGERVGAGAGTAGVSATAVASSLQSPAPVTGGETRAARHDQGGSFATEAWPE